MATDGQGSRIPDVLLERYLADDLSSEQRQYVEQAREGSEAVRQRLAELAEQRQAFLDDVPPAVFAHQLATRLSVERPSPTATKGFRAWWALILAPSAAAAAAVVLAVSFTQLGGGDQAVPLVLPSTEPAPTAGEGTVAEASQSDLKALDRTATKEEGALDLEDGLGKVGSTQQSAERPRRSRTTRVRGGRRPKKKSEATEKAPRRQNVRAGGWAEPPPVTTGGRSKVTAGGGAFAQDDALPGGESAGAVVSGPSTDTELSSSVRRDSDSSTKAPAEAEAEKPMAPATAAPAPPADHSAGAPKATRKTASGRDQEKRTRELSAADVRRVVFAQRAKLQRCLREAVDRGELEGTRFDLVLSWRVDPAGTIRAEKVKGPGNILGTSAADCVIQQMRGWRFPRSTSGTAITKFRLSVFIDS